MKRARALIAVAALLSLFACSEPMPAPVARPLESTKVAQGESLPDLPDVSRPSDCKGWVALSFDDGPTDYTDELLAVLAYYDVPATFFNLGQAELNYPMMVKRTFEGGHQFGNHTMTHADLAQVGFKKAKAEMVDASNVHVQLGQDKLRLFRPPFGSTNNRIQDLAEDMDMTEALWTVDSKDYETPNPKKVAQQSEGMEDGGILLLHDGKPQTVEALPMIIDHYYDKDLCFGRIGPGPAQDTPIGVKTKVRAQE